MTDTEITVIQRGLKGFTLIELLVVMGIIAVLASLSIFGLRGARESGRDAKRKADLETIRSSLELYKADCNQYPPFASLTVGNPLTGDNSTSSCLSSNTYIDEVPDDPVAGNDYSYNPSTPPLSYTLCAALEGDTVADIDCLSAVANCGGGTCSYSVQNP